MAGSRSRRGVLVLGLILPCFALSCGSATPAPEQGGDPGAREAGSERQGAAWCERPEGFGPVKVPPDVYEKRAGAGIAKFSALTTSQATPLEECGLRVVLERLASLTCDGGEQPFGGDLSKAHASRAGNVGEGGRCGSILDLYEIPCPEKGYEVYADMYFCTAANAGSFLE